MAAHMMTEAVYSAPVVALHSSMAGSDQWAGLNTALEDWFSVYAFDLPSKVSTKDCSGSHDSMAAITASVIVDIEELGTPVHLVGHSMGGAVALKIAQLRPELVRSLTLFEPAAFHVLNDGDQSDQRHFQDLKSILQVLNGAKANLLPDLGMKALVDFWDTGNGWDETPGDLRSTLIASADTLRSDLNIALADTWRLDALDGLNIPTLVLLGMDSPDIAMRTASLIVGRMDGAELAILPGLGHMAPVSAPDWVNPRIHQHIARVERSADMVSWPSQSAA